MRKAALLVGIDEYKEKPLSGCVEDVERMHRLLSFHGTDGPRNFDCEPMTARKGDKDNVTRASLRQRMRKLFSREVDVALFFFSGHGTVTSRGAMMVTQDYTSSDEGIPMEEVISVASASPIREVIIIADVCFAGNFGVTQIGGSNFAFLREGVSILTASTRSQGADIAPDGGGSVFTRLVCEALEGAGADLLGTVTTASVYAYADQALGGWDQRPMFKSNVSQLSPLRQVKARLPREKLRLICAKEYFKTPDYLFPLDASYEENQYHWPPGTVKNPEKEKKFALLRQYTMNGLVVPVDEEYLYWAAIRGTGCRLTALGQNYWRLAKNGRL